jgi:predicted lipoprotein with Yx(FWY)xxD motif
MRPRRVLIALAATAALGLVASSCSEDTSAPAAEGGGTADVVVTDSDLGQILTDADGNTLYVFLQDTGGESACTDDCATAWPPLVADGTPTGDGVDGELGTIERSDGTMQVTVGGAPLYHYSGDSAPGDTNGQGVGEVWYVASSEGTAITEATGGGDPGYGYGSDRYGSGGSGGSMDAYAE